jgi:hypothetical protein
MDGTYRILRKNESHLRLSLWRNIELFFDDYDDDLIVTIIIIVIIIIALSA